MQVYFHEANTTSSNTAEESYGDLTPWWRWRLGGEDTWWGTGAGVAWGLMWRYCGKKYMNKVSIHMFIYLIPYSLLRDGHNREANSSLYSKILPCSVKLNPTIPIMFLSLLYSSTLFTHQKGRLPLSHPAPQSHYRMPFWNFPSLHSLHMSKSPLYFLEQASASTHPLMAHTSKIVTNSCLITCIDQLHCNMVR